MAMLKAGIIGCGGRGRAHAFGYQASDGAEMVACADTVRQTAERMAEDFGIPNVYGDYREMLGREKLNAVSICLWTGLHHDAVMASIEAGVRLINCEKPMAPTWGEAKRMYAACEEAGVLLTFSHQTRYGAAFTRVRDLVREGAIGELIRIEGFCSNLFDLGTHRFDRMFFYNDETPAEWVMGQINCADERAIFAVPVETHGISYVRWKNGVTGVLFTGDDHGSQCQDRLIGADGMIENGLRGDVRVLRKGHPDWEVFEFEPLDLPGRETALYILDAIACLETGEEPLTSGRKALQETELIFATYESARRRARVALPLDIEDSPLISMLESGEVTIPDYPARLSSEEEAEGFRLLFNGRDLTGWKIIDTPGAWGVEKGLLTCNGGGRGWIRPEETYTDFVLRLQYKIAPKGNSGIFLRTSEEGRPAFQGMEIQLLDDRRSPLSPKSNGAIYDAVPPTLEASRPAGAWNDIEVSCRGPMVRVVLNRREVVACDTSAHPDLKDRLKSGFIGLQDHRSPIAFRDIRIKVLDSTA